MRTGLSILLSGTFIVLGLAVSLSAEDQSDGQPVREQDKSAQDQAAQATSVWMRKKMDYSQAILRGLALGDFGLIQTNARQMNLLNKVEGFVRRRNPQYTNHVRAFEQINNEIIDQAKEENLAGVTLAFNQLTVNCVSCHSALRKEQQASANESANTSADGQ